MNALDVLVGKTLKEVVVTKDNERVIFITTDGTAYAAYHLVECCESVEVHSIEGDTAVLLNTPITAATEEIDSEKPHEFESWTWTRHRLTTAHGTVTFVWLGKSNGYYGETPYFGITHE